MCIRSWCVNLRALTVGLVEFVRWYPVVASIAWSGAWTLRTLLSSELDSTLQNLSMTDLVVVWRHIGGADKNGCVEDTVKAFHQVSCSCVLFIGSCDHGIVCFMWPLMLMCARSWCVFDWFEGSHCWSFDLEALTVGLVDLEALTVGLVEIVRVVSCGGLYYLSSMRSFLLALVDL